MVVMALIQVEAVFAAARAGQVDAHGLFGSVWVKPGNHAAMFPELAFNLQL